MARNVNPSIEQVDGDILPCRGVDPDIFFSGDKQMIELAKRLCGQCTIRIACCDYALKNDVPYGVWGGIDSDERQNILRKRKQSAR